MRRLLPVLGVVVAFSLAAPRAAHAYIDPLSGSIAYQALVAGILGALFTARRWVANLVRAIRSVLARRAGR